MSTIEDISSFVFTRLFFPKKIIIDTPGIIINKLMQKYGTSQSQHRALFFFEDIMSNLQKKSIQKLGEREASELWYEVGKDVAYRYFFLSNTKKLPSFLQKTTIEYALGGFSAAGQTFAKNVVFDSSKKSLIAKGDNNIVCRKTKLGDFSSGLVSGVVSFFTGENIEAKNMCRCPNCLIVANAEIPTRYLPNLDKIKVDLQNYNLNFPYVLINKKEGHSFKDLIKFRKIIVDKNSKLSYGNHALIIGEVGLFYIIADKFIEKTSVREFEFVVISSSEKIAKGILKKHHSEQEKINETFKVLSALGFGTFSYKKEKKLFKVTSTWTPYCNNKFYFQYLILCGFMNTIYNTKFCVQSMRFEKKESKLHLSFFPH
ncbi:MAG: hypothetical protein WC755_00175 [Candidatus Woesearchaeota archaeon]|jgi:hypothetical protein